MAKVCKSGGEGTFAERHGNGEVAPAGTPFTRNALNNFQGILAGKFGWTAWVHRQRPASREGRQHRFV
jgi:hypothetical protein